MNVRFEEKPERKESAPINLTKLESHKRNDEAKDDRFHVYDIAINVLKTIPNDTIIPNL